MSADDRPGRSDTDPGLDPDLEARFTRERRAFVIGMVYAAGARTALEALWVLDDPDATFTVESLLADPVAMLDEAIADAVAATALTAAFQTITGRRVTE